MTLLARCHVRYASLRTAGTLNASRRRYTVIFHLVDAVHVVTAGVLPSMRLHRLTPAARL